MIGFATVGVANIKIAKDFYDKLFSIIGIKMLWKNDRAVMYGVKNDEATFAIILPFNKEKQEPGNGNMVAIKAHSVDEVNNLHNESIAMGGLNEGDPGKRDVTFYGSYVRDLDGNKLCFYCRI